MKILIALYLFLAPQVFANQCGWDGKNIGEFKSDLYEIEYAVKVPFPPKILEVIEKYFGKFSVEKCVNAIVAAKLVHKVSKEAYYAFYTNQNKCDGGNSYGVIIKEKDVNAASPVASIEDGYIDCL